MLTNYNSVIAVPSIVCLTYSWSFLQKMRYMAGQMGWIGRAWTVLIRMGEWSGLASRPRWFKQEWEVMPPLEAHRHCTASMSPSHGWMAVAVCTWPCRGTTDSFPVTYFKTHWSYHKMKGSHPSILCACLSLQSFELGGRRCVCGLLHASKIWQG